ncbi:GNAT family N-acetyltransferase [Herbiconiux sp. P16]|uniref:GNAT family N-acetyltransferase n=1 Tax=Herbiconiux wuyangfengii TaxID=3342794 RepID=UPI0035BA3437
MGDVRIRAWGEGDLGLLLRGNTPEMTAHLGGPESDDGVRDRQDRYLRYWREGSARMFVITLDAAPVGGIGWWPTRWHDDDVYEAGWFVVPEGQGHGVASAALQLTIADAREHGEGRLLTAFPATDNLPSNRLCEKAGFALRGQEEFPFRGIVLHVNVWAIDLGSGQSAR